MAAISSVVISGDWEGSVLFFDSETQSRIHFAENCHAGGVSAVTVFHASDGSGEGDKPFAGSVIVTVIVDSRVLLFSHLF